MGRRNPRINRSSRRSGAPRQMRRQWVSRAGKATFYPCLHDEPECGSVLMTFKGPRSQTFFGLTSTIPETARYCGATGV